MIFTDLNKKQPKELNKLLKEQKMLLFELRLKLKTMQLTNTAEIAVVKKDIAKINTAITEVERKG